MKINIIYWSGTGNTEAMANFIKEGVESTDAIAIVKNVSDAKATDVDCDILCLGCPSMGSEVLEESEFEPYIDTIESSVRGKKLALFGSYDWGDGQWMRDWAKRMENAGAAIVCESFIVRGTPDGDECKTFGIEIAK